MDIGNFEPTGVITSGRFEVVEGALFWILFAIPEGILMVLVGLGCFGIRRPIGRLVLAGALAGTTTVISRSLLPAGYHIPVALFSYCIIISTVLRVSMKVSILACLVSSLLVNFGQMLVALPLLGLSRLSIEDTLRNPWLHITFGWLSDILLLAVAIFVTVRKVVIFPIIEPTQPESGGRHGQPRV